MIVWRINIKGLFSPFNIILLKYIWLLIYLHLVISLCPYPHAHLFVDIVLKSVLSFVFSAPGFCLSTQGQLIWNNCGNVTVVFWCWPRRGVSWSKWEVPQYLLIWVQPYTPISIYIHLYLLYIFPPCIKCKFHKVELFDYLFYYSIPRAY